MRRPCNQNEFRLLSACEADVLSGPHEFTAAVPTSVNLTAGILGGVMGGIIVATKDRHDTTAVVIRVTALIAVAVICFLLGYLVSRGSKEKKLSGLLTDVRFVNMGTIMSIDVQGQYIYFIEDGFVDGRGFPYLMCMPVKNTYAFQQGMRVVVLMNGRGSYFLMRYSERTQGLLLNTMPPYDYFSLDLNQLTMIPHPALPAQDMNPRPVQPHEMAQARKAQKAAHMGRGLYVALVSFGIATIAVAVIMLVAVIAISAQEKMEAGVGFCVWLIVTAIFGVPELILWLVWRSKVKGFKNLPMTMTNVCYSHFTAATGTLKTATVVVYEKMGPGFVRKEIHFPGFQVRLAQKANYGQMIHKYEDGTKVYYDF